MATEPHPDLTPQPGERSRLGRLQAALGASGSALQFGVPLLVIAVGTGLVADGALGIGTLVAASTLVGALLSSGSAVAYAVQQVLASRATFARVNDLLEAPRDDADERTDAPAATHERALRLVGVEKKYPGSEANAVEPTSFELRRGETLVISGPTGSGKTTLLRLICGLEHPTGGKIEFDGVSSAALTTASVRSLFGVVPQEPQIVSGTIRENLAAEECADEQLIDALRTAALVDEVLAMPMGLDTSLGDGGIGLSGGQRQRLAIARAIVRDPDILVLDEATGALDVETEARVLNSIRSAGMTLIVVSHRPGALGPGVQELHIGHSFSPHAD